MYWKPIARPDMVSYACNPSFRKMSGGKKVMSSRLACLKNKTNPKTYHRHF
jgi:hypothetical protein